LTRLFPEAAALSRANLQGPGLSAAKASTLRALARAVDEGHIDFAAPVDEVRRSLAAVPGIGASVAEHVALRALAEPDALPGADLVLRRAVAPRSQVLDARRFYERAEAWHPWRGYAAMHLWCE
jgi:AraC family transcriptional regulator of adaptative response / DNA-3-methyladenine glycosylase II